MARLNRGKVRYKRYQSCRTMSMLALIVGVTGEEDLFVIFLLYSMYRWSLYRQLCTPTTLPGLRPLHDFFDAIGGFDFKELFRFEKHHFLQLLRELELPDHIEVSR